MVFVSVTRLRLRSWRFVMPFFWHARRSLLQAKNAPRNLGVAVWRPQGFAFWTATLWQNEEAMRAYRGSDAHKAAMPRLIVWCDEASVAHWTQESNTIPTPEEAATQMATCGKLSNLKNLSADHRAGRLDFRKQKS